MFKFNSKVKYLILVVSGIVLALFASSYYSIFTSIYLASLGVGGMYFLMGQKNNAIKLIELTLIPYGTYVILLLALGTKI